MGVSFVQTHEYYELVAMIDTLRTRVGICQTCKHWVASAWHSAVDDLSDWKFCDMMQNDYGERTLHPESKAVAEDCEDYHALVRTRSDFGCNQHEENQP